MLLRLHAWPPVHDLRALVAALVHGERASQCASQTGSREAKMSVRTMARVWAGSKHDGTHLLMLLAIADFADDDGRAYPSVGTLAVKCRMSPRNANFLLAKLRDSGELDIKFGAGPFGTNAYRIRLSDATPLKPTSPPPPEAGFTLKPASSPPEAGSSKPLKPTSPKPSLNHQEPSSLVRKRTPTDPEGFPEFWSAWPSSDRKQDRKKCAAKWRRARFIEHLAEIVAHVEAMKGTRQWREGYEPAPLTYLNGERWRDGMPTAERTGGTLPDADHVFKATGLSRDLQELFRRGDAP